MAVVVFLKILLREARVKQSMYIPPKKARSMRVAPIRFTNPAGWYANIDVLGSTYRYIHIS